MVARPTPNCGEVGLGALLVALVVAAVLLAAITRARNLTPRASSDDTSDVEQVVSHEGNDPAQAIFQTAEGYQRQRRYAQACELYRHILDQYPAAGCAASARRSLVVASAMLGDEAATASAVEGWLRSLPKNQEALDPVIQVIGDLYTRSKYDPARRLCEYVIENWPATDGAASARMCLVDMELAPLVSTWSPAAAQEKIENLLARFQGNPYLLRTIDRIGDRYAVARRYAEAEAVYQKVIALATEGTERGADAQMAISWLYFERGLYDDALREYTRVVQDYPKTKLAAGGQYWLAQCYLRKNDLERAAREYQKTIDLYPGDIYAGHAEKQLALLDRRKEIEAAAAKRREAFRRTLDQRSSQTTEARVAPPPSPAAGDYEARVAAILERFASAVKKAYQDAGLTPQDVEHLLPVAISSEVDKARAYRQTWPAILKARQAATDEMVSLGAGAVPFLLRARDKSGERRGGDMFAPAIGRIGAPAVPAAIEGLSDTDVVVRLRAADALGRIRDPRAVEPLIRALADSDRTVLMVVVEGLGGSGDARAAEALLALWDKQDIELRGYLARALGHLHEKRAVEPILTALEDWISTARKTGVWADATRWSIRLCLEALGDLGGARAIPLLEKMLLAGPKKREDDPPAHDMALQARQALRRLGCEISIDEKTGGYKVIRRPAPGTLDAQAQSSRPQGQIVPGAAPDGAAISAGLRSLAVCAAREIQAGEPVVVELWLENVSDGEITYYDFRKEGDETSVITVLVDGRPVRGYTTLDTTGYTAVLIGGTNVASGKPTFRSQPLPVPREAFQTLGPGEKVPYLRRVDLGTVEFRSETKKGIPGPLRTPGDHSIQIEYRNGLRGEQFGLSAWTGTLRSNIISVKVLGVYESRVAEILQRFYAGVEKAYQDIGLSQEDRAAIGRAQRPAAELMERYRQAWPATLKAREAALDEMALLGPEGVPALLTARDESGERRGPDLFVSVITRMGDAAVPAVIEGLSSADATVRHRAATALGGMEDRRAVEPLIRALDDPERIVLGAAIRSLGRLADRRAVEPLLSVWYKHRDVRPEVAMAFREIKDARVVEPLLAAWEESLSTARRTKDWDAQSWPIRSYISALEDLGDARVVPLLKETLLAGPEKTKTGPQLLMAEAAAGALRRFGFEVTGDSEEGYRVTEDRQPDASGTSGQGVEASLPRGASAQGRDYEAAKNVPQPMDRWRAAQRGYYGAIPRGAQMLGADTKRPYPVTLVWPLIQGAGKYVVHVQGVRGSRAARSFEGTANSLQLERADVEPGRYQWSVLVYNEQGEFLGDVDTIDPPEVFAIADSKPIQANGKSVLMDLHHTGASVKGWGLYDYTQYLTKELLEQAGFQVQVHERGLLTPQRLATVDLLLCHYAPWGTNYQSWLPSELAAAREFIEKGGSLLVIGCDRTESQGRTIRTANELLEPFGFRFSLEKIGEQSGIADIAPDQAIISFDQPVAVQFPVGVEGEEGAPLLRFRDVPIARAKLFGKGKILVAGVGVSFLDRSLGDREHGDPRHPILFQHFIQYLTDTANVAEASPRRSLGTDR